MPRVIIVESKLVVQHLSVLSNILHQYQCDICVCLCDEADEDKIWPYINIFACSAERNAVNFSIVQREYDDNYSKQYCQKQGGLNNVTKVGLGLATARQRAQVYFYKRNDFTSFEEAFSKINVDYPQDIGFKLPLLYDFSQLEKQLDGQHVWHPYTFPTHSIPLKLPLSPSQAVSTHTGFQNPSIVISGQSAYGATAFNGLVLSASLPKKSTPCITSTQPSAMHTHLSATSPLLKSGSSVNASERDFEYIAEHSDSCCCPRCLCCRIS